MRALAAKRPDEAVLYTEDFSLQLGSDTIETGAIAAVSGDVAVASSDYDDKTFSAVLSGGTADVFSSFSITITTVAGQTLIREWGLTPRDFSSPGFASSTTKAQLRDMAFEEIGLAGYEFDATAEEQASALRRLDVLMAQWGGPPFNFQLSYNTPSGIGESDPTDASGIPDFAADAVVLSLALSIMPAIGKTMSAETRLRLTGGMMALRAAMAQIPNRSLPPSALRGAGNKFRSPWWPYNGAGNG